MKQSMEIFVGRKRHGGDAMESKHRKIADFVA